MFSNKTRADILPVQRAIDDPTLFLPGKSRFQHETRDEHVEHKAQDKTRQDKTKDPCLRRASQPACLSRAVTKGRFQRVTPSLSSTCPPFVNKLVLFLSSKTWANMSRQKPIQQAA
jgi:hypothetical protein